MSGHGKRARAMRGGLDLDGRFRALFSACALVAAALLGGAFGGVGGWATSPARAEAPGVVAQALEPLTFETPSGARVVAVEVARSEPQRTRGLMGRRFMPEDRGMLFLFDRPQIISMWMKNTYIPLDMVFVGQDGRVVSIAANAEPFSEAIVSSSGPAVAVVEINGGVARRMGMRVGDRVRHPALGR